MTTCTLKGSRLRKGPHSLADSDYGVQHTHTLTLTKRHESQVSPPKLPKPAPMGAASCLYTKMIVALSEGESHQSC